MDAGGPRAARVLIAGGGIAGVEAALAVVERLAGDARVTLISQEPELTFSPLSVTEPFGPEPAERHDLERLLGAAGIGFVHEAVTRVLPGSRQVELGRGRRVSYDRLILCIGARGVHSFRAARTFWSGAVELGIDAMIRRARSSESHGLGLIVPPEVDWPLPIYELALLIRRRARSLVGDLSITIYTPESSPLAIFGPAASAAVGEVLAAAHVGVTGAVRVTQDSYGHPYAGARRIPEDALIALPRLVGPQMPGLPGDGEGFVEVDERLRVAGVEAVLAAGDGTNMPVKQGGLAAQAADAAAARVAFELTNAPRPARPTRVLRARLYGCEESLFLVRNLADPGDPGVASADPLWWPPLKVAAPRLAETLTEIAWRGDSPKRGRAAGSFAHEWHPTPLQADSVHVRNGSAAST